MDISIGEKAKLNLATAVAATSRYRWRVGAVLEKGGRIIAWNTNSYRNDVKNVRKQDASTHAEIAVLRQVLDVRRAKLFVARVYKDGSTAIARPCDDCMPSLIAAGIHKVFWTEENDSYGWLKL